MSTYELGSKSNKKVIGYPAKYIATFKGVFLKLICTSDYYFI